MKAVPEQVSLSELPFDRMPLVVNRMTTWG